MTCHHTFNTALSERAKYPLTSGRQKLQEAQDTLKSWREMVTTIATRIRAGGTFGETENLGPCMANERETYLKELPAKIAYLIAYKVLPAIAALEDDGMPKAEVERLLSRAETDAQRLLDECEAARLRLKVGIDHEYKAMRRGESLSMELLDEAYRLIYEQ
jgi:hypothetical protein